MSIDWPSVSVIIPARNEAGFIAAAVQSVRDQAYPGTLDCIVVDNGSSDGTGEVTAKLSRPSGVPVAVVGEPVPGVGSAKNTGAAQSKAQILIFLDADSRLGPGLVQAVGEACRDGRTAGSIRVVSDGGAWIDRAFFLLMEFGKRRFGIRAQMLYCGRSLFQDLGGFDPKLKLGEDVDFLSRARKRLQADGRKPLGHLSTAEILTSPRRLAQDHHFGMLRMFARWLLAFAGVGREQPY